MYLVAPCLILTCMKHALLCLALAATLTACGGHDSPAASSTRDVQAAAQRYSDAYLTGDASTAYALLSRRCQARIGHPRFVAVVHAAANAYGKALSFSAFAADVQGDQARLTYAYASTPAIDQKDQPWVLQAGSWRYDSC